MKEILSGKERIQMLKLYIENRAFVDLQESSAIYKHHQIIDLAFKMNKLKTKK